MFYNFNQTNSGGKFKFDEKRGVSVNVIVEGKDLREIIERASRVIHFGCYDSCSCCGDRWWEPWPGTTLYETPQVYGITINPGDIMPYRLNGSELTKWLDDGVPEGFIHYADGRIESFWATMAERDDLGNYGWGVGFNRTSVSKFRCVESGWDETGNRDTPWAEYSCSKPKFIVGSGKKFTKGCLPVEGVDTLITVSETHSYGRAWFRNEADADAFVAEYKTSLNEIYKAIAGIVHVTKGIVGKTLIEVWENK